MMQIFMFDDKDIKKLKKYAMENIIDLSNGIPKNCPVAGDNPKRKIIGGNIRVVYSIEKQPAGNCHHLSVSKRDFKLPSVEMVQAIMEVFGMDKDRYCRYDFEDGYAISIVQRIGEKLKGIKKNE